MATILSRLGRFCFRRRRWVLSTWLVVLAAAGGTALSCGGWVTQTYEIPGTEADRAQSLLVERFGAEILGVGTSTGSRALEATEGAASSRVVVGAAEGESLIPEGLQIVLGTLAPLAQDPGVAGVSDPVLAQAIAPDGSVTYIDLQFADSEVPPGTVDRVEAAAAALREAGFEVAVTGGPFSEEIRVLSGAELIGVAVALVVLVVVFGSLLAAGIPIVIALIGVGIGAAGVLAVAGFADVSSGSLALALMLGVAVGIDYGLFLMSRHRQQLAQGITAEESTVLTMGTAGNAVVLAASTVIIALVSLSVVGIPFLTYIGLTAAAAVAIAVVVSLTLVPAAMGFAGARLMPNGRNARDVKRSADAQNRWGQWITRHPIITVVSAAIALLVATIPAFGLRLGLPDAGQDPPDYASRQAYDMLAAGFGPGFNAPLVVLVDGAGGDRPAATAELAQTLSGLDVAYVAPAVASEGGDAAFFVVVPRTEPNAAETTDLVTQIRDLRSGIQERTGAEVWVTGAAAANVDISRQLADALPRFLMLVVGLAFLLLMIAFRSLLVPLTATLGYLLAIGGAFGATVAVYQWGWLDWLFGVEQPGPLVNFLPIVLVGVLFGLAMDYQVFLVSRMREVYVSGAAADDAARLGFAQGSRVVLAAALTTISVFTAFVFGGETLVAPIAFALAAGITLDALVVRMTVIPAVMALLGRTAWWLPRWLDRALPNVDLEAASLGERERQLVIRTNRAKRPVGYGGTHARMGRHP
jgi:putative drug exporter of the RND superfamily